MHGTSLAESGGCPAYLAPRGTVPGAGPGGAGERIRLSRKWTPGREAACFSPGCCLRHEWSRDVPEDAEGRRAPLVRRTGGHGQGGDHVPPH